MVCQAVSCSVYSETTYVYNLSLKVALISFAVHNVPAGEAWTWHRGNCEPHFTRLGSSYWEKTPLTWCIRRLTWHVSVSIWFQLLNLVLSWVFIRSKGDNIGIACLVEASWELEINVSDCNNWLLYVSITTSLALLHQYNYQSMVPCNMTYYIAVHYCSELLLVLHVLYIFKLSRW